MTPRMAVSASRIIAAFQAGREAKLKGRPMKAYYRTAGCIEAFERGYRYETELLINRPRGSDRGKRT